MCLVERERRPPSTTLQASLGDSETIIDEIKPKYGLKSFLGLMFRQQGRALIELPNYFQPAIHTFFMRFSLDLIFLRQLSNVRKEEAVNSNLSSNDESFLTRVVYLKKNAQPWGNFVSPESADYVLEVEAGLASETDITRHDLIRLEEQQ